jgi:hypothetical protein
MAHTPGPWRVEQDTTLIWGNCNPDDSTSYGMGYPVADCQQPRPWRRESPTDDEIAANARLIAAAPELLAALIDVAENYTNDNPQMWGRVHAAIAKAQAEGKDAT